MPQTIGGGPAPGPNRSALLFDEVRRHRPYSGNSRIESPAGTDDRSGSEPNPLGI